MDFHVLGGNAQAKYSGCFLVAARVFPGRRAGVGGRTCRMLLARLPLITLLCCTRVRVRCLLFFPTTSPQHEWRHRGNTVRRSFSLEAMDPFSGRKSIRGRLGIHPSETDLKRLPGFLHACFNLCLVASLSCQMPMMKHKRFSHFRCVNEVTGLG